MDTQNPNAHSYAQTRGTGKKHPLRHTRSTAHPSGITHEVTRHTSRFTVVGNHLAQHPELSGLAIGLGVHIQSLPTGARADIKTLAARFPEGPTRIAAALRELEAHGYLRRTRERTESGRIVTRTVSCNQPGRHGETPDEPRRPARRAPEQQGPQRPQQKPSRRALPAVPKPAYASASLLRTAVDVLTGLRREDPRLLLSATDAEHLAPGVAAWLERDLTPTAVRHALTTNLPREDLRRPAALLAHRLTAQLPPLPPYRAPEPALSVRHPLRNCDSCDRAFRGPESSLCRACTSEGRSLGTHSATDAVRAT
ncbi:helix-turn-helix domain-containing protein [Streptomyces sp. MMBL 11-3]|uniref:helix-turn-helix domain-containing protein n=1 Tax=Streptomyces sp. MMBL 11-3 TaxID=3382639 RepID=UPI0039B3DAB0